ncbi:ribosome biogenesis GTPase YlqF [Tetragenococcus muriaticus]|uniref:ribosome biogenesis GTPase YlqF n=1 Tax=Tetragenococcus muriaticus TaxID=64642 RepID=UPI00040B4840|nr:ribosome biogenesis GTPase YlqF [Tetragenococcus muriaticus]GMA46973.1 ribosome biogenesis GTPase A [Tetragenococcus muriaticus]
MTIQWFPGHMAKAKRQVAEKLQHVDIVFELVDGRLPVSSRNPMLDEVLQQKPRLVLINKADLADPAQTKQWENYFSQQGLGVLAINSQDNKGSHLILPKTKEALTEKLQKEQQKGLKPRAIRAMVIGIPNVGKSTLLNRLAGKKFAKTGNSPGVTKGQQWVRYKKDLELLDTPGILWPKFEDQETGKRLALTGAIKEQLLQQDDIAIYGLDFFLQFYPDQLARRYQLTQEDLQLPTPELLMLITQKQGFQEDYDKGSQRVIHDIREGKLGRFTLDRYAEVGE